jgi:aminopeptidase-like protein
VVSDKHAGRRSGSGEAMYALAADLFPICRSITGDGVRETLGRLRELIPIETVEVPSGTAVLDWTVPREWNIRDAFVKNARGERVIDFRRSNLHIMSYSTPVHATLSLRDLRPHLFADERHPSWIPYRTSYYRENWGFCLSHDDLHALQDGDYEVLIDSSLTNGALTYGECLLPGAEADEVLISCHICHPSLANDNLSGICVATALVMELSTRVRRYSYRFLFVPGTIGAITWLARNRAHTRRIRHGLVLTCVGDPGPFHYKKSRQGAVEVDRAMAHVIRHHPDGGSVRDFTPYGYDERQFCSPGFDLPVGCLMRSVWGEFPQYHSSADDLSFITPDALAGSLDACLSLVDILEANRLLVRTDPYGEPALGRRGLYGTTGGGGIGDENLARLWVLNLADGRHDLLEIADRADMSFALVHRVADELLRHGLLTPPSERT